MSKSKVVEVNPAPYLFSPTEIARNLGFSYRQFQYWCSTGLVVSEYERLKSRRGVYSVFEVISLAIVARLRACGYSIQKIRVILPKIKALSKMLPDRSDFARSKILVWRDDDPILVIGEIFGSVQTFCTMIDVEKAVHLNDWKLIRRRR